MTFLNLILPTLYFKKDIIEYKNEFIEADEDMPGTSFLDKLSSVEEWLQHLKNNSSHLTVEKGLVLSTTYLAMRLNDKRLIGMIDIRHQLNNYLACKGGHIGYSVRRSERNKGYGTEILRLGLNKCEEFHINKVLITCNKSNIASAKVIMNNNGKLENEISDGNKTIQRYWINIR